MHFYEACPTPNVGLKRTDNFYYRLLRHKRQHEHIQRRQ